MTASVPASGRSFDGDQLALHLTAAAHYSELPSRQAAIGLLAETDWLRRIAGQYPNWVLGDDAGTPLDLDWHAMATGLQTGRAPEAKDGELAVLRLALGLHLAGYLVPLGEILPALDGSQTQAAVRAVTRAAGRPQAGEPA